MQAQQQLMFCAGRAVRGQVTENEEIRLLLSKAQVIDELETTLPRCAAKVHNKARKGRHPMLSPCCFRGRMRAANRSISHVLLPATPSWPPLPVTTAAAQLHVAVSLPRPVPGVYSCASGRPVPARQSGP